jgi:hypothetical protein
MYASPTCEISLLLPACRAVRQTTPAMYSLQEDLVDPAEEARQAVKTCVEISA